MKEEIYAHNPPENQTKFAIACICQPDPLWKLRSWLPTFYEEKHAMNNRADGILKKISRRRFDGATSEERKGPGKSRFRESHCLFELTVSPLSHAVHNPTTDKYYPVLNRVWIPCSKFCSYECQVEKERLYFENMLFAIQKIMKVRIHFPWSTTQSVCTCIQCTSRMWNCSLELFSGCFEHLFDVTDRQMR